MENFIGKTCPYCHVVIQSNDDVVVCPVCGVAHHKVCWQRNDGCTTSGCSEQSQKPADPATTVVCANCGAEIRPEFTFCKTCGAPRPQPEVNACVCPGCGAPFQADQQFCEHCGRRLEQPVPVMDAVQLLSPSPIPMPPKSGNKKKTLSIVLPIVIAFVLIASIVAGVVIHSVNQKKKKDEYIEMATGFVFAIGECGSNLENIRNEIYKSWNAYVNSERYNGNYIDSVNSAIAAAQATMSDTISDVESYNSAFKNGYQYLMTLPDPDDAELIAIRASVKEVYDDYQVFYDCVMDPTGSYKTWVPESTEADEELSDSYAELAGLLGLLD